MRKRRRILTVAGMLVLIAVILFFLIPKVVETEPTLIRGWLLFLTVLLAVFLALGQNAARWVAVIVTGFGALGGFVVTSLLVATRALGPGSGYVIAWLSFVTIAYGCISRYLAFSTGVSREIRRIREHYEE